MPADGVAGLGKAYQTLATATRRYVDLREARRQLWGGEPPDDELFLIENIADLWQGAGVGWRGHLQVKRKPWPLPVNSFAYVLWIATGIGGEGDGASRAWIPTMEEYEEAAASLARPLALRVGRGHGRAQVERGSPPRPEARPALEGYAIPEPILLPRLRPGYSAMNV